MIKRIQFENYKAFEKGEIRIKPITILLGANSVGKSSVIQLLLLLQQTALSSKYKSALKLHGEFVSLGENENLFKDKNTSNDLILKFQVESDFLLDMFKEELLNELIQSIIAPIEMLQSYYFHSSKNIKTVEIFTKKSIEKAHKSKKEFLDLIEVFSSSMNTVSIEDSIEDDLFLSFRLKEINKRLSKSHLLQNEKNYSNYGNLYDILKGTQRLTSNVFDICFNITNIKAKNEDILKVTGLSVLSGVKSILDLRFEISSNKKKYSNIILTSDFIKNKEVIDSKTKDELLKTINYDSTLFYLFKPVDDDFLGLNFDIGETSPIVNIINKVFYSSINLLKKNFSRELINYVSPLRAHPKRYYFLDKAKINTFLDTLDGDSLTEILKENTLVKKKVNNWLNNFNFSVDVSTLQDVIHKLKINQSGLELDITDVGFGISQVLPVIVQGFLSYKNSLTIIEQPEIHLHPTMQADLADLFIDIVFAYRTKKPTKFLLIETHSEYLLKRLRRRMSEGKKITSENVAVYFFNQKDKKNTGVIEERIINKEGAFKWPTNFYSGELLKDTVEFLKNQS